MADFELGGVVVAVVLRLVGFVRGLVVDVDRPVYRGEFFAESDGRVETVFEGLWYTVEVR